MKSDAEYKELSIREFTKAAEVYDSNHAGIYEMCKDDYPPILAELRKDGFDDLLDVGCGTGPMIELLAAEIPGKRYIGLDLTPRMIEVANAKGIDGARFVVGDAEDLPFDDASFDAVICANSFHHYTTIRTRKPSSTGSRACCAPAASWSCATTRPRRPSCGS